MKKVALFLVLISLRAGAMLSQMEMGQAKPESQEHSMYDACCDCASSPKFYISAGLETRALGYLVDKAWVSLQQQNQTAFLPTLCAGAIALNMAAIAGTGWYCFRQSKFKPKED